MARHSHIDEDKANQLQRVFTTAFPDAEIEGYQPFANALELPDPDDRHVLAAAIVGRCNGIVTANLKHFPSETVARFGIEVVHPDDFIVNIVDLDEKRARRVQAASGSNDPIGAIRGRLCGLLREGRTHPGASAPHRTQGIAMKKGGAARATPPMFLVQHRGPCEGMRSIGG
jgi:hypothetical protein